MLNEKNNQHDVYNVTYTPITNFKNIGNNTVFTMCVSNVEV